MNNGCWSVTADAKLSSGQPTWCADSKNHAAVWRAWGALRRASEPFGVAGVCRSDGASPGAAGATAAVIRFVIVTALVLEDIVQRLGKVCLGHWTWFPLRSRAGRPANPLEYLLFSEVWRGVMARGLKRGN